MKGDYSEAALKFGELFGLAQGMNLKLSHLTKQGMELVFESDTTRTEVKISPKVYTMGKVIIDAINDLTMIVEIKQMELSSGKVVGGGKLELPYSTWFFEGDFM